MKRFLISLGVMAAAALSLTNCTKEIDNPVQETEKVPYTIYASSADTKTVNDGFSTKWADGDALTVFYAEAGSSSTYSANTKFTLKDAATGEFTGELATAPAASNDWYALYPYEGNIMSPANTSAGYLPVGQKVTAEQVQEGNSNMNHIAGNNYPMWGIAKTVSSETLPGITMTHLTSLVKVNVTNSTSEPLTVSLITLTAEEDICGTYYIDFSSETPVFTPSGDTYVSNTATLRVSNGEAIAADASAAFYLAVKPFTAKNGQKLVLNVNGLEKTVTVSKDVAFAPGMIKTLNFNHDEVVVREIKEATISEFLAAEVDKLQYYRLTGTISNLANTTYGNFDLVDEDGNSVYVYGLTATKVAENDKSFASLGLKEGDTVTLIGTRAEYQGTAQVGGPAYYESHVAAPEPEPEPMEPLAVPAVVDLTSFIPADAPSYMTYKVGTPYSSSSSTPGYWKFGTDQDFAQFYVNSAVKGVRITACYNEGGNKNSSLSLFGSVDGGSFNELYKIPTTVTSDFDYVFMVSDNTYRYFKVVYNKDGGNLAVKSVAFDNREQLAAPQNVKAVVEEGSPNTVILTWDAVENATMYEVSYDGLDEPVVVSSLTHTFEGLTYGKEYSFSVVAIGDAATYQPSEVSIATVKTGADPNVEQPEEVTAEEVFMADAELANGMSIKDSPVTLGNLTFTYVDGGNTNNAKYYTSGKALRIYYPNSIMISSTKVITKLEIIPDVASNCVQNPTVNTGTITVVDGVAIWTGEATSVTITPDESKTSGNYRIASVKATYAN